MTSDPKYRSNGLPVAMGYGCCHAKNLDRYRSTVGDDAIESVLALGERLSGIRICHINSTPFGDSSRQTFGTKKSI